MSAPRISLLAALPALLLALPGEGTAQRRIPAVEVPPYAEGRLPAAYVQRLRANPGGAYEVRGWSRRTEAARAAWGGPVAQAAAVTGTLPVVVIPARFSDSPEPTMTAATLQAAFFDGPSDFGTIPAFYEETSGGALRVRGTVTPWVRTGVTRAEAVGASYGLGDDGEMGRYLADAVRAADAAIDFSRYDSDGPDGIPNSGDDDGVVDAAVFQFHEIDAACGGNGPWPHRYGLSGWNGAPAVTNDMGASGSPIVVEDYIAQGSRRCNGAVPTSATLAHELGHILGLPDLYDATLGVEPGKRRWTIGCWGLMSGGAWGCVAPGSFSESLRPVQMEPWSKRVLGWGDEVVVPADQRRAVIALDPVQTSGTLLRIPLSPTEYLHLEYRPNTGFDRDLPAAGVLAYRVIPELPLRPCQGCAQEYKVSLVEADGNGRLFRNAEEGGNRGEAGDVFARAGSSRLTATTTPALRLRGGAAGPVAIHDITVRDGKAFVTLSTAPLPMVTTTAIPAATPLAPYSARVDAGGGVLPYTWTAEDLPAGVTATPLDESLVLSGTPLEGGDRVVRVTVRDATGAQSLRSLALALPQPPVLPAARLVQAFTRSGAQPLSAVEQAFLDQQGNRNGRYDVGDLRKYVLAHPELASALRAFVAP